MTASILVAGIGNIFFGDDGFGVEVARRLTRRPQPADVRVVDFGIRGLDLAYALLDGWDAAILIDAMPRGGVPGTLYVIEPSPDDDGVSGEGFIEPHGMNPVKVLGLVRTLGGRIPHIRLVGCEPAALGDDDAVAMGLSDAVQAALDPAVALVESLVAEIHAESVRRA